MNKVENVQLCLESGDRTRHHIGRIDRHYGVDMYV
jgi:hypothetical protein